MSVEVTRPDGESAKSNPPENAAVKVIKIRKNRLILIIEYTIMAVAASSNLYRIWINVCVIFLKWIYTKGFVYIFGFGNEICIGKGREWRLNTFGLWEGNDRAILKENQSWSGPSVFLWRKD